MGEKNIVLHILLLKNGYKVYNDITDSNGHW